MPHTKQSCFDNGAAAAKSGNADKHLNPFAKGSWQHTAWEAGYDDAWAKLADSVKEGRKKVSEPYKFPTLPPSAEKAAAKAFAGISATGDNLAPFPARMPAPTREHLKRLNTDALTTKDSTRALRLDNKITALYQRYA